MNINAIGGLQTNNNLLSNEVENVSDGKKLSFENLLNTVDGIENNQLETRQSVYTMLRTGEGDTTQAMIDMQKASSQIKTASVVRDKVLESYQTIMNMQI